MNLILGSRSIGPGRFLYLSLYQHPKTHDIPNKPNRKFTFSAKNLRYMSIQDSIQDRIKGVTADIDVSIRFNKILVSI